MSELAAETIVGWMTAAKENERTTANFFTVALCMGGILSLQLPVLKIENLKVCWILLDLNLRGHFGLIHRKERKSPSIRTRGMGHLESSERA